MYVFFCIISSSAEDGDCGSEFLLMHIAGFIRTAGDADEDELSLYSLPNERVGERPAELPAICRGEQRAE